MRVMAVTSRYPPDYVGGYELACEDVTERLRARGHEVHVLTSRCGNAGVPTPSNGAWVHRVLDFVALTRSQAESIWARTRWELRDNDACRDCIRRVRPNVITVWDAWGLLPSLLTTLERTGIPVTYAISSPWALEYASTPHRWQAFWDPLQSQGTRRRLKSLLRNSLGRWVDRASPILPSAPDLRRAFFVSRALRAEYARAGWDCADAPVIYHGIDTARFYPRLNRTGALGGRLLIAGRVVPEKGIHTAIEALRRLVSEHGDAAPSLDIVGPLPDTEYAKHLRQAMVRGHLEGGHVRFHEQVPRSAMPDVYRSHDALVFPSIWEEPFSLTMLEAMACGLPVIGTDTGGSKEILEHEVTGLVFEADEPESLCYQITRLRTEPGLGQALAVRALDRIRQHFTVERTVLQVETFLSAHAREAAKMPLLP